MLSTVFRFKLPEIGEHGSRGFPAVVFGREASQVPLSWDLDVVLRHLVSSAFEPLESVSLRALAKKTLFLVSLTTANRVGELQAFIEESGCNW